MPNSVSPFVLLFFKIDSLSKYVAGPKEMNRPLSFAEGLTFVKQAFYDGDSANYQLPHTSDIAFLGDYLKAGKGDSSG